MYAQPSFALRAPTSSDKMVGNSKPKARSSIECLLLAKPRSFKQGFPKIMRSLIPGKIMKSRSCVMDLPIPCSRNAIRNVTTLVISVCLAASIPTQGSGSISQIPRTFFRKAGSVHFFKKLSADCVPCETGIENSFPWLVSSP